MLLSEMLWQQKSGAGWKTCRFLFRSILCRKVGNALCLLVTSQLTSCIFFFCREVANVDPEDIDFIWDVSTSIHYSKKKSLAAAGTAECFTTQHSMWHTRRQRFVAGLEEMAVLGYPVADFDLGDNDPNLRDVLTDRELRHLAGDTQALPVITSILATAMSNLNVRSTPMSCSCEDVHCEQMSLPAPVWLEPHTFKETSVYDDICKYLKITTAVRKFISKQARVGGRLALRKGVAFAKVHRLPRGAHASKKCKKPARRFSPCSSTP